MASGTAAAAATEAEVSTNTANGVSRASIAPVRDLRGGEPGCRGCQDAVQGPALDIFPFNGGRSAKRTTTLLVPPRFSDFASAYTTLSPLCNGFVTCFVDRITLEHVCVLPK